MRALIARFVREVIRFEGSSRPVAVLRILLGAAQWSEHADRLTPHRSDALNPITALFFLGSTAMVVGVSSREAAFFLGAMEMGLALYYPESLWGHHHTWLLAFTTFLLAFTPCDRSLSLDRWLSVRAARRAGQALPAESGPLWATRLIALQLVVLYALATVDKWNLGFLSGERLEMIFAEKYTGSVRVDLPGWIWLMRAASWGTVVVEAGLAIALWFPRLRGAALLAAISLHASFYLLIPVGTFSVVSVALWIVVFDPQIVHRVIDDLLGPVPPPRG